MGHSKGSIIILFIVGLAVIGLVSSLVNNPGSFLISILVMVGIGFVIFMIMRAVLNRGSVGSSDEMKKYKKAVKQSKVKYQKEKPSVKKRSSSLEKPKVRKKRKNGPHLTVIEGKKGTNKKDQASN